MKFIEKIKNNKFLKGASLVLKGITSIVIIFVICIIFIQRISNNKVTLGGISMYTVVSESMKPKYEIYDMLIAKKVDPSTIKVGDDVVYMGEKYTLKDKIVTHQVIKKNYKNGKYIFQTKGINNDIADPEIEDRQILAIVISKSNILSIISHVVNNSYGFYFIIFVPFVVLLFFEIVDIKKEKMALKEEKLKKKEKIIEKTNDKIEKTNEKTINEEPKVIKKEINEDKKNKIDVMEEPVLKKINKG